MSTAVWVWLSAAFWILAPALSGQFVVSAVFAVGHVLFWQNHVLEVKLNKLLDNLRLHVPDREIDL